MNQIIYESIENAQESILDRSLRNIFLVSNGGLFRKCGAESKLKKLLNYNVYHFDEFSPNPKIEDVKKGIEIYRKIKPEIIIAVGGGSSIDMAKLIKGLSKCDSIKECLLEKEKIDVDDVRMLAIPTTVGSGSESTPFAVVYMDGLKYSLEHEAILPNKIVLDPTLTYSLSRRHIAISGMDALTQAIESYWSVNSNEKSKNYSRESIKIILNNLEEAANNQNRESMEAMMKAANLSGRAIAISKTTACHAISYPITSRFGIPHGHAVSLTLGEVLEYNSEITEKDCRDSRGVEYVKKTMRELFELVEALSAEEANKKINRMMSSIGLETRLSELGINNHNVIISEGFIPQRMYNNPRIMEEENLRKILSKIN